MKVIRSAWEAAQSGLASVYLDDSVLDQMLRGCAEVHWEIQGLFDQGITVMRAAALCPATSTDHATLREALQEACELPAERRDLGDAAHRPAALWSALGTPSQRSVRAATDGLDLYEPQIVLKPSDVPLTSSEALRLAQQIGALSPQTAVELDGVSVLFPGQM